MGLKGNRKEEDRIHRLSRRPLDSGPSADSAQRRGRYDHNRWTPVLDRFLQQLAERVKGFGGDPSKISPSPTGWPSARGQGVANGAISFTAKMKGLIYDHFGDFEAFVLEIVHGREVKIASRKSVRPMLCSPATYGFELGTAILALRQLRIAKSSDIRMVVI